MSTIFLKSTPDVEADVLICSKDHDCLSTLFFIFEALLDFYWGALFLFYFGIWEEGWGQIVVRGVFLLYDLMPANIYELFKF
jgi:hypothetical protein